MSFQADEKPRMGNGKSTDKVTDYELAVRAAKLWPNRKHEANALLGLFCRTGLHRWRRLDLSQLAQNKDILHCFWCSKVKVDGVVYEP